MSKEFARGVLTDGVHSEALYCRWQSWRVVGPRALALDMPPSNCTDMDGAIGIAQVLMPGVLELHVYCDGAPDIVYSCVGGQWQAFDTRKAEAAEKARVKKSAKP